MTMSENENKRLDDMLTQLGELRKENNNAHDTIFDYLREQNGRVRKLEQWRAALTGGLALLTFVIGTLGTLLVINPFS